MYFENRIFAQFLLFIVKNKITRKMRVHHFMRRICYQLFSPAFYGSVCVGKRVISHPNGTSNLYNIKCSSLSNVQLLMGMRLNVRGSVNMLLLECDIFDQTINKVFFVQM